MTIRALLSRNIYYDSITLMSVAQAVKKLPGVEDAGIVMATATNCEMLRHAHLFPDEWLATQEVPPCAEDILLVVRAVDEQHAEDALAHAVDRLTTSTHDKFQPSTTHLPIRSLERALNDQPSANLVAISVAGEHAWLEAEQALRHGLHVFLFSDNVPIEQERRLKLLASEKGLLLMGPDCGTALINGVGFGFCNVVPRGPIGIVGASGTGMQQLMCLIAAAGSGISQAIGTGGRDLSEEIGGRMMKQGLTWLAADEETKVIMLVSKPPAERVAQELLAAMRVIQKPIVVVFLSPHPQRDQENSEHVYLARTLTEGAEQAVALAGGDPLQVPGLHLLRTDQTRLAQQRAQFAPSQRFLRALYSGGTLCDEAMLVLSERIGPIASNIPLQPAWALAPDELFRGHTALDLGSDEFTRGRPHPMIDPTVRLDYLARAAADPATAVILLDIVLGYCTQDNPAATYAEAIALAKKRTQEAGCYLAVIVSLCGTEGDPQRLSMQRAQLESAGALVYESNMVAALATSALVKGENA